jgi:hypothetical protein
MEKRNLQIINYCVLIKITSHTDISIHLNTIFFSLRDIVAVQINVRSTSYTDQVLARSTARSTIETSVQAPLIAWILVSSILLSALPLK